MARLVAAWGTYVLPEILCIKDKKCHEVIQEKERLIQHQCLREKDGWANFHHGHKEHTEGQSHIFLLSHTPTLRASENKWACPIPWDKLDINLVILPWLTVKNFQLILNGHLVILAEQSTENEDGNEGKLGKNTLPPCFFQRKILKFSQNCFPQSVQIHQFCSSLL